MNKQLEKYLRTRAVREPWQLEGSERDDFRAAVVIPALAEAETLPVTLRSLAANPPVFLHQTLVVVVVNNRAEVASGQRASNRRTLDWMQGHPLSQLNLAWVDASSAGRELPAREGVGLARKIGFDLALERLDWLQRPFLISLDADTLVDQNYLPALFNHFQRHPAGGAVVPFRHQCASRPRQELAIRYYELYLRSYLFGLQQAGSPYAYHTIGSAFASAADCYLAAGGMNRRAAAEDFYFLQQLNKVTGVERLCGTLVRPSPRFSERVPFGTGVAVREQVEEQRLAFKFSSCSAFSVLKDWLVLVDDKINAPAAELLAEAGELSFELCRFLEELNFAEVWGKLQRNHPDQKRRLSAFRQWFDALRSRQLLTRLDNDEDRPAEELVSELLAWGGYPGKNRLPEQLFLLEGLQGAGKNAGGQ